MPKITSTNKDKEQSIRWKDKTFTKTINGWKTLDSDRINKLSTDYPSTTNTQLVPSHVIRRRPGSPTPWFDADCRAQSHITVNVIVSNVATDVHIVLLSLSVKEFLKSVKIWQSYCQSLEAWFFWNTVYISKVTERAVVIRLNDYLAANDLLPRFQSAYGKRHSTETAMLRVWSDILKAEDRDI